MNKLKEILLKRLNKDEVNTIISYLYNRCKKCNKLVEDKIYIKNFQLSPKNSYSENDILFPLSHFFGHLRDKRKKYMVIKNKEHHWCENYYPWKPIIKNCPTIKSFKIDNMFYPKGPYYYVLHPYVFHYILDKFKNLIYCSKECINSGNFPCESVIHGNNCLEGCDSNERVKIYNIYMEFQHIFYKLDQDILNNYKLYSEDKKSWNLDYNKIIREL